MTSYRIYDMNRTMKPITSREKKVIEIKSNRSPKETKKLIKSGTEKRFKKMINKPNIENTRKIT